METLMTDQVSRKSITYDLGIAANSFSSWSKRKTYPAANIAVKIARALGVTVEYLVDGTSTEALLPHRVMLLAQDMARLNDKDFETVSTVVKALAAQYRPDVDQLFGMAAEPEEHYMMPEMKPLESDLRKKAQA